MPPDDLEVSIRVYDHSEKTDSVKRASFTKFSVPREDSKMKQTEFIEKYIRTALGKLTNLPLDAT